MMMVTVIPTSSPITIIAIATQITINQKMSYPYCNFHRKLMNLFQINQRITTAMVRVTATAQVRCF
jgi:hypothetical protein